MENVSEFKIRSNTSELATSIIDVLKVAEKNGLTCWLNYGALLGMVRENRLLPWNNDAELSCWYDENIKQKAINIVKELSELGYNSYYYAPIGTINVKKKGVDININCFWKEGDYVVRPHEEASKTTEGTKLAFFYYWLSMSAAIYMNNNVFSYLKKSSLKEFIKITLIQLFRVFGIKMRKRIYSMFLRKSKKQGVKFIKTGMPVEYFNEFESIDFYESKVNVPLDRENLLAYIYGDNWRIPKDKWSFYADENKSTTKIKFINESWNYNNVDFV